jgi:RHS repeat-associated protein
MRKLIILVILCLSNMTVIFVKAVGSKEKLYLGGDCYTAPAVAIKQNNGSWAVHYIIRDYLGSIVNITNSSATSVQELSYDAWGRLRNPVNHTAYAPGTEPELLLGRGYTGHEHLTQFGLINMNARLYDPAIGRFLSPDPYVQNPFDGQSYNRYSYCLNNPLSYIDPSGEIAWFIPIIIGAAIFGTGNLVAHAVKGDVNSFGDGLKYFGQGALVGAALGAAWQFAPLIPYVGQGIQTVMTGYGYVQLGGAAVSTVSGLGQGIFTGDWSALENAGKIFAGNFYLDENRPFIDGVWQGFSRHTWEFIQTGLGHTIGQVRNAFGAVDNVDYFGGATLINDNDNSTTGWWGFTLGPFINSKNLDINHDGFRHEYGHTLQSKRWGFLYPFVVGIPSALSSNFSSHEKHNNRWYEKAANRYGERYYRKYLPNYLTLRPWDDIEYPRH